MADLSVDDVRDAAASWEVTTTVDHFHGRVVTVRTDSVRMPGGDVVNRDYVVHPGSVAVLPLDDDNRVLMLRQYRHPTRRLLWELAAGLRDVQGEPLWRTAARELAEEAGWQARHWHTLVDVYTSPGMTDERSRVFLARGLSPVGPDGGEFLAEGFRRRHEEADMPLVWVPLADAVRKVLAGDIRNSLAVMGILATCAASADGFTGLRPADSPES
ncbi:NUDIX domain-containing protein [Rhizohabitans arisaemae]|uniref:NUDIX domain-containing protein n=1 Tax=Rhizohabitans arisaemae TaxID=2720610 RepID=UPI0024B19F2D|nr:NUDIX hydrolase [Rhizohabitans arisaemae]